MATHVQLCAKFGQPQAVFHNFVNTPKNVMDNSVLLWLTNIIAKCRIPITFHDLIFPPKQSSMNKTDPNFSKHLHPSDLIFLGGKHLRFLYSSCSGFCLGKGKVYYLLNITFTVCSIMHTVNAWK
jgi:hypothetical protein